MHRHAVFADLADTFAIDLNVVNRLAGFSAGEGSGEEFDAARCVVAEEQGFADAKISGGDEFLLIFAPERMADGCADDVC